MWRYIFLYFCSAIGFAFCGLIVNAIQLLLVFTVKKWNLSLFQKINSYLCYTYFSLYNFFVDWYSGVEYNLYMDKNDFQKYFGKEHSFAICNHSYEIDWILLLSLAEKGNVGGNSKTFIKNVVQYVPGFGMVLYLADYVCLARNFEKDKKTIEKKMTEILNYPDPIWLVLYPEGTRFTKAKYEASKKFAEAKGLPQYKYHLTPRTKGFITSLPPMKDKMGGFYDITIAFNPNDENKPSIQNIFFGRKIKVYLYIKRIPFKDVPTDEKGANQFILDTYTRKDKLRDSFYKTGDFFKESGVERVDKIPISKSFKVLINALFWIILSTSLVLYYLLNLIISGFYGTFALWVGLILLVALCLHKGMGMSKMDKTSSYGINNNKTN